MKKILTICFIFIFIVSCNKYFSVYHISEREMFIDSYGFYYLLPKTILNIEITVIKTTKIKGPYANYANKYLDLTNIIKENSTHYNIADISITSYNVPDAEKIYFVKLPKKIKNKNLPNILLNEYSILTTVNFPIDSFSQYFIPPFSKKERNKNNFNNNIQFSTILKPNLIEVTDTIYETVILDTIKIKKPVYKRSFVEKSLEQKAKETSEHILKLNNYKLQLLSGYQEVPYPDGTIQFMVNSIDQQINEYVSLFSGKTIYDTLTYNFTFVPDKKSLENNTFLFSFCSKDGLSDIKDENENNNIYINITPSNIAQKINAVVVHQKHNIKSNKGFYYSLPEKTKITLTKNNKEIIFEKDELIHQFGATLFLPPSQLKILLDSKTFSLKRLE